MSDLNDFLAHRLPYGVYEFKSHASRATIKKFVSQKAWRFIYLDGRKISNKAEFLNACAHAFSFPSYFGKNWDAFEECLHDLPSAAGYLVLFESAMSFTHTPEWQTAHDIWQTVAAEKKLFVFLR